MRETYRNHRIVDSVQSGGKAGKGRNRTSSLRVHGDDTASVSYFRYVRYRIGATLQETRVNRAAALAQAKKLIDARLQKKGA